MDLFICDCGLSEVCTRTVQWMTPPSRWRSIRATHPLGNTARFFGFRLAFDDFDDHAGGFEKLVVTGYLFASLPAAIPLVCEGKKHALFRP